MFSLRCTQILENHGLTVLSEVRFELHLNGEPTRQFCEFRLEPDMVSVGDVFMLTASDFGRETSKQAIEKFGSA